MKLPSPEHEVDADATPRRSKQEPISRASQVEITWSLPVMGGQAPSARGGHSACLADTQLLVFGGHFFGGHGEFVYLNDLHRLDLETSTWHAIPFTERDAVVPGPRYNHSALLLDGNARMFVFGGRGAHGVVYRDMFFLDLEAVVWRPVQWTTDCPSARFGHAVATVDDTHMLLFGGWDGKQSVGDLWRFDSNAFAWHRPKCSGKPPVARHDHAMVVVSSDLVMVYGGYSVTGSGSTSALPVYHKDVYLFDMESNQWSRPRLTGEYPVPTFSHALSLHNEIAFVLGGWSGTERSPLYMGDKHVRELVQTLAREERLATGHAAKESKQQHTRQFKTTSSYVRTLDITTMEWFRPVSHGVQVGNRYGHSVTLVGKHLFLFGGWDGNRALNQVVVGEFDVPETSVGSTT